MVFVSVAARDQRRQPKHRLGVHPGRRRHPAGPPGDGLLPARVRRLRGRRAAGRGDARSEAEHPPGDRLVGDPDRDLLRVLLLRGDRLLRPGQDGRLLRRQRQQPVGRHGRGGPARHRQPTWSRSRSSTAAWPTRTRAPTRRRARSSRSGGRGSSRRRSGPSTRPIGRRRRRSTSRRSSGSSSPSGSACSSATSTRRRRGRSTPTSRSATRSACRSPGCTWRSTSRPSATSGASSVTSSTGSSTWSCRSSGSS